MERRNRSLKALKELIYIDSLDSYEKADALVRWNKEYIENHGVSEFDLELDDLKKLEELFFKCIEFLKVHKETTRQDMIQNKKLRQFLKN